MTLIIYILFAYGLSNMLVYASGPLDIIDIFRTATKRYLGPIGNVFDCMMCTSANVGWVTSLLNIFIFPTVPFTAGNIIFGDSLPWYIIIFIDLCFTSGIVWLLNKELRGLKNDQKMTERNIAQQQENIANKLNGAMGKDMMEVISGKKKITISKWDKVKFSLKRITDKIFEFF